MSDTQHQEIADQRAQIRRERALKYYYEKVRPNRPQKKTEDSVPKSYTPEYLRAYHRAWYEANKEHVSRRNKELYQARKASLQQQTLIE